MGGKSSKAGGGLGKKITTQLTKLFKEIDTDNSKTISKEEAIEFCAYICFVFLKARRRCGSPPGIPAIILLSHPPTFWMRFLSHPSSPGNLQGGNFTKVNATAMFAEVDEDDNGEVSLEEWLEFWTNVKTHGYDEDDIMAEIENIKAGEAWIGFTEPQNGSHFERAPSKSFSGPSGEAAKKNVELAQDKDEAGAGAQSEEAEM